MQNFPLSPIILGWKKERGREGGRNATRIPVHDQVCQILYSIVLCHLLGWTNICGLLRSNMIHSTNSVVCKGLEIWRDLSIVNKVRIKGQQCVFLLVIHQEVFHPTRPFLTTHIYRGLARDIRVWPFVFIFWCFSLPKCPNYLKSTI